MRIFLPIFITILLTPIDIFSMGTSPPPSPRNETDPIFSAHPIARITENQVAGIETAAEKLQEFDTKIADINAAIIKITEAGEPGGEVVEKDPVFMAHPASTLTSSDVATVKNYIPDGSGTSDNIPRLAAPPVAPIHGQKFFNTIAEVPCEYHCFIENGVVLGDCEWYNQYYLDDRRKSGLNSAFDYNGNTNTRYNRSILPCYFTATGEAGRLDFTGGGTEGILPVDNITGYVYNTECVYVPNSSNICHVAEVKIREKNIYTNWKLTDIDHPIDVTNFPRITLFLVKLNSETDTIPDFKNIRYASYPGSIVSSDTGIVLPKFTGMLEGHLNLYSIKKVFEYVYPLPDPIPTTTEHDTYLQRLYFTLYWYDSTDPKYPYRSIASINIDWEKEPLAAGVYGFFTKCIDADGNVTYSELAPLKIRVN